MLLRAGVFGSACRASVGGEEERGQQSLDENEAPAGWPARDLQPSHGSARRALRTPHQLRDSIVVSISACHAEDPGSIPGRGIFGPCRVLDCGIDEWGAPIRMLESLQHPPTSCAQSSGVLPQTQICAWADQRRTPRRERR